MFRLKKKYVWYTEYTINIIIYIFLYIIVKFTLLPQPTCTLERNFCETKRLMTLCCFPINFYSSQLWDKLLPFLRKKIWLARITVFGIIVICYFLSISTTRHNMTKRTCNLHTEQPISFFYTWKTQLTEFHYNFNA